MQVSPASAQDQSMPHLFMIILSRRQPFLCCLFRAKLGFSAHREIYRFYYFRQHIICNNTHTHARTLTHTRTPWRMVLPPQRLVSDWMSDAADSCTPHIFYEYITFYVHPNTDLSSRENQRGQTRTH